jgi:hypothetical protein
MFDRNGLLLLPALLVAVSAPAQIKLIAHTSATNQSKGTGEVNTTGANFFAVCEAGPYGAMPPTDSVAGNNYVLAATAPNPGYWSIYLYVAYNPKTSASEKWIVNGGGYPATVEAFSGVSSLDKSTTAYQKYPLPLPSLTPSTVNELVLSCFQPEGRPSSPLAVVDSTGGSSGISAAYQVQNGATPVAVTWTQPNNGGTADAGMTASFFSIQSPAPLVISNKTLPEGFAGAKYELSLQAGGGVTPYRWSGTMPPGLTLSPSGEITGTPSRVAVTPVTITVTDSHGKTASSSAPFTVAATQFAIKTKSCPPGKQYQPYPGCTIAAVGGTPPYTFTWAGETPWTGQQPPASGNYAALVEGLTESSAGVIGGAVKGQGIYTTLFLVTDATGATISVPITFSIAGENSMDGCSYPADSIYYQNVSHLPVDTSPAAPIYPAYVGSRIRVGFGQYGNGPNGIAFYKVDASQPMVTVYSGLSNIPGNRAPIPFDAPMEGTRNGPAGSPPIDHYANDNHVLILQTAGGANRCKEYSLYNIYPNYPNVNGSWGSGMSHPANDTKSSDLNGYSAYYADMTKYDLVPQGQPGADAAGLPVIPLLENYDEVLGSGTPGHENGVIREMKRFTLPHTVRGYVWPATHNAGTGGCTGGLQDKTGNGLMSQMAPPTSCKDSVTAPMGEIYRLKANVPTPACAGTSPQARIIIQGFRDHGIILADNGLTGALIGTPDPRWNMGDLECLGQIKLADFEPVKVQQLAAKWPTSSKVVGGP